VSRFRSDAARLGVAPQRSVAIWNSCSISVSPLRRNECEKRFRSAKIPSKNIELNFVFRWHTDCLSNEAFERAAGTSARLRDPSKRDTRAMPCNETAGARQR
jgi:hypothetical protein